MHEENSMMGEVSRIAVGWAYGDLTHSEASSMIEEALAEKKDGVKTVTLAVRADNTRRGAYNFFSAN